MNKKIIVGVITIFAIIIIFLSVWFLTSPSVIIVDRAVYNPKIKYIPITDSFIKDYPPLSEIMKNLDSNFYVDEDGFVTPRIVPSGANLYLERSNLNDLMFSLDKQRPDNPGYEEFSLESKQTIYYVEYQEKYYWISAIICFPSCPYRN